MKNRRTKQLVSYLVFNEEYPHGVIKETFAAVHKMANPKTYQAIDASLGYLISDVIKKETMKHEKIN